MPFKGNDTPLHLTTDTHQRPWQTPNTSTWGHHTVIDTGFTTLDNDGHHHHHHHHTRTSRAPSWLPSVGVSPPHATQVPPSRLGESGMGTSLFCQTAWHGEESDPPHRVGKPPSCSSSQPGLSLPSTTPHTSTSLLKLAKFSTYQFFLRLEICCHFGPSCRRNY